MPKTRIGLFEGAVIKAYDFVPLVAVGALIAAGVWGIWFMVSGNYLRMLYFLEHPHF